MKWATFVKKKYNQLKAIQTEKSSEFKSQWIPH